MTPGLQNFNKRSRAEYLEWLSREQFDLLIIGGGITGASIFRDAALRGVKVALVEAKDFASGTSGRSSKLIHGGLRYIRNLGLHLAWESCHERNLHIRLNKRLVRPHPFLMPIYQNRGELVLRAGMILYEILSGFSNYRFHRFLSREETLSRAPGIPADGLTKGCFYYDAEVSDGRWTIETLKDGVRNGGIAINHAPVQEFFKENGKLVAVNILDSGQTKNYSIRARCIVNATGIFADRIRRMDDPEAPSLIRLSKGTHLVFSDEDVPVSVTVAFSSPVDRRPLFLAKRERCFLYGTTDDWQEASPDLPLPEKKDVEYLLTSLQQFMPHAGLDAGKVQFVYSGFRPLLSRSPGADASSSSREDSIEISRSGLLTVIGGKLTTSRRMAVRVLDRVSRLLSPDSSWRKCQTHRLSIGGTNADVAEGLAYWVKQRPRLSNYFRILYQRYGVDAHEICAAVMDLHHTDPEADPIKAEAEYVCRHEMVCTLEDLIERRAGFLYWNAEKRLEQARYGSQVIRTELGLSEQEFEQQYQDYQQYLARFHSLPEG